MVDVDCRGDLAWSPRGGSCDGEVSVDEHFRFLE